MEKEVLQLMDMGATRAQARAALRKCKDVMDAAERIFSGEFSEGSDTDEVAAEETKPATKRVARPFTPDEDEDGGDGEDAENGEGGEEEEDDDDDMDQYEDEDDFLDHTLTRSGNEIDPYAGVFFSKDRREEVIEVEEQPEYTQLPGTVESLPLMTQGEWMKGCPEGGEQSLLFGLWNDLREENIKCPHQCGGKLQCPKGLFTTIWPDFTDYVTYLREHVHTTCPTCSATVCLACHELVVAPRADKPKRKDGQPPDPLFHCTQLQGILLGMGLSMVEKMFEDQLRAAEEGQVHYEKKSEPRRNKKRKVGDGNASASGEDGTGEDEEEYLFGVTQAGKSTGKRAPAGTGYGGAAGKEDQAGITAALEAQKTRDTQIGNLLGAVRVFVPSLRRQPEAETSDYLPHPTALVHVRRRFNSVSSALLRNDSLADMSDRQVLYFELLEWLETVSNHEALASIMGMPIMVPQSTQVLPPRHNAKGAHAVRERKIVYEGSSGPRELLEAIVIQARAAIKGYESTKKKVVEVKEMTETEKRKIATDDLKGKGKGKAIDPAREKAVSEDLKLFTFCNRILATTEAIDRSLLETKGQAFLKRLRDALPKAPWEPSTSNGPSEGGAIVPKNASDEDIQKIYEEWAKRTRFEYCDLTVPTEGSDVPAFKSVFSNEAKQLVGADIPKRSLAIAKELAVLSTNLPVNWNSSVFLRVDETRVDVIKALITGPEGTPYENGCYVFDIFLGGNYNTSPPNVKYLTTNDGKFRFNPNLYAEGKVCLSLLGTWSGPGWIPGKSTLLQVLISIQSMILSDEPYLNEPGWEAQRGTPASDAYSANVRRMVVHSAMMGNLKNPPEPFADVIRTHFRLKARSLQKQLDKWLSTDDGRNIGEGVPAVHKSVAPVAVGRSESTMAGLCKEFKKMLQKLEKEQ